ncbi:minor tail protein [Mycobacterium phage Bricole]|uniref:Minor tail protein n=1 Tax=Mycobacterium phage Bricole TaxID=1718601 RepID=A0A0M4S373_9CAUD|nr:minor tail protein [Mycobacterium phage Bricole]
MPWSPAPVSPLRSHRPAWFPEVPAVAQVEHRAAWFPRWKFDAEDAGVGSDEALLLPDFAVADRGVGADSAGLLLPEGLLEHEGLGSDLATVGLFGADGGIGSDAVQQLGLFGSGDGIGNDGVLVKPLYVTGDAACGADVAALLVPLGTRTDSGVGADMATSAGFAPHAALAATFSTAGAYTFTIPVWCRYIDVILLGAGGGGRGMMLIGTWGEGGWGGNWSVTTLERGVHIPWTARTITGAVGAGGSGSSAGLSPARGATGGSTTASTDGWSGTATGGIGGQNAVSPNGRAVNPRTQTVSGQTYTGGDEVTPGALSGTTGAAPGGGGSAAITTGVRGGAGARGQAWFYCYQ